jgi:hypothetical protein
MHSARGLVQYLCLLVPLLGGCSIGPGVIRCNFLPYNESVASTENEQFLLNLVRLRYRDPPKTLGLSQVTSQFTYDNLAAGSVSLPSYIGRPQVLLGQGFAAGAGASSVINPLAFATTVLGPFQSHMTDVPTVTLIPQTGADFARGLVTPVPLERIVLLAGTGWDLDRLLRLLVAHLNNLENVPNLAGRGAEVFPTNFREFRHVADVLGEMHARGLLALAVDPSPVPFALLSEPFYQAPDKGKRGDGEEETDAKGRQTVSVCGLHVDLHDREQGAKNPAKKDQQKPREKENTPLPKEVVIKAADLISAADKHYRFHVDRGGAVELRSMIDVYDMIVNSDKVRADQIAKADWDCIRQLLKVGDSTQAYNSQNLAIYHLLPAEKMQLGRRFDPNKDIYVATRSVLSAMLFASRGIDIPVQHYQEGLVAPPPTDEDGQPFYWPEVTDGLFHVHVSKRKPKDSFVAVKYRDYWFYIAADDLTSKSTFDLLLEMLNVQVAPGVATAPILTLSTSGPGTH